MMITKKNVFTDGAGDIYLEEVTGIDDPPRVGDVNHANGRICSSVNISAEVEGMRKWTAVYEPEEYIPKGLMGSIKQGQWVNNAIHKYNKPTVASRIIEVDNLDDIDFVETPRTSATEAKRANENAMKLKQGMKVAESLLRQQVEYKPKDKPEIQLHNFSKKDNAYDKRLEGYNRKPSVERDDKHIVARIWGWLGILTTLAGVIGWAVKVYGWVQ